MILKENSFTNTKSFFMGKPSRYTGVSFVDGEFHNSDSRDLHYTCDWIFLKNLSFLRIPNDSLKKYNGSFGFHFLEKSYTTYDYL